MHDHHHADHHHHSHDHHHHHSATGKRLVFALTVTLVFAVFEVIGGLFAGSLALIGDAGHMFSDSAALGLAAFAAWLAKRPVSRRHSYGMVRAEVVAALINVIAMTIVVAGIVGAAVERFQNPHDVEAVTVMWVAAIGLLVNIVVAWVLSRGEQSLNVRGALLHVLGDLLGSIAALVSGAVIYVTGWMLIDPILSLVICLLIAFSVVRLLKEVLNVIMEGVPLHIDLGQVGLAMARVDGIDSVHDLHIWTLASGNIALSAHVVIRNMQEWEAVLARLKHVLHEHFDIDHVTLQPERSGIQDTFIPLGDLVKTLPTQR